MPLIRLVKRGLIYKKNYWSNFAENDSNMTFEFLYYFENNIFDIYNKLNKYSLQPSTP
jgi:hypothetical protein